MVIVIHIWSKCVCVRVFVCVCVCVGPSRAEETLAALPLHRPLPGQELPPGHAPQTPVEVLQGTRPAPLPAAERIVRRGGRGFHLHHHHLHKPPPAAGGRPRRLWLALFLGRRGQRSEGVQVKRQEAVQQRWRTDPGRDTGGDYGGGGGILKPVSPPCAATRVDTSPHPDGGDHRHYNDDDDDDDELIRARGSFSS